MARPQWCKFWTRRRQQENALTGDLVDGQSQQFQRSRIDPVQIFEHHQHRLLHGELIQLPKERI
jgi:hypothetical protein